MKDAALLINKGKLKKGLALIEKALIVNPYNAYGWDLKGRVLDALNDALSAQECYQKAKKYGLNAILTLINQRNVSRKLEQVDKKLSEYIFYM